MKQLLTRIDIRQLIAIMLISIVMSIGGYLLWQDTNPSASADNSGSGDERDITDTDTSINWDHYAISATSISKIAATDGQNFLVGIDESAVHSYNVEDSELAMLHSEGRTNFLQTIVTQEDKIWAGFLYTGLTHFDGAEWSSINRTSGLLSNSVSSVAITDDGQLWVGHGAQSLGMSGGGLSYQVDGEWQTMPEFPGIGSSNVSDIAIDNNGDVWISVTDYTNYLGRQSGGLMMYDGQSWHVFGTENGLIATDAQAIAIAPNGDVWVATTSGISVYKSGLWFNHTAASGVASDFVVDIAIDGQGRVFAATHAGVSIFDGVIWGTMTETEGLFSNVVNALATDDNGGILIATDAGVSRLTISLALPEPSSVVYKYYMPVAIK